MATVGDSLCVLSRSGRAVKLLRMHRLNNIEERHRVEKAGGTVINNRCAKAPLPSHTNIFPYSNYENLFQYYVWRVVATFIIYDMLGFLLCGY